MERDPILESLGFKFWDHDGKDLFIECVMPAGWKKVPTDHSMWSNLLDDKGRIRANIFYKAAFYDRDAFMDMETRFKARKKYTEKGAIGAEVLDGKTAIYTLDFPPALPENSSSEERLARYGEEDRIVGEAVAWLKANYPDYENPAAYWD